MLGICWCYLYEAILTLLRRSVVANPLDPKDIARLQNQPNNPKKKSEELTEGLEVISTDHDFSQIATFEGPGDIEYLSLAERVNRAIQTWQLLVATERGESTAVQALVKRSINVNLTNRKDQTALLIAAKNGKLECTRILLGSRRVDFDHQDNSGNTALHLAVYRNDTNSADIVYELLKAGASMYIWNNEPESKTAYRLSRPRTIEKKIRKWFRNPPLVEGPPAQIQQCLVQTKPPKQHGEQACKRTWVAATEVFYERSKEDPEEKVELHMTAYKTVKRFIYSKTPIDDICIKARPKDVESDPHCRWYHIPANNMAWIHDLFAKLNIHTDPWPRQYRDGGFPHSRWMSPEASVLPNLDDSKEKHHRDVLAIFMPYISYEESTRQVKMSNLIDAVQKEHKNLDAQDTSAVSIGDDDTKNKDLTDTLVAFGNDPNVDSTRTDGGIGGLPGKTALHVPNPEIHVETTNQEGKLDPDKGQTSDFRLEVDPESPQRTLDQSYYSMLPSTSARDSDQVEAQDFAPKVNPGNDHPDITEQDIDSDEDGDSDSDDDDDDWKSQIVAYLTHDPPLHPRRTLDQSYYHMLPSTSARDSDQVVARRAKKEKREGLGEEGESFYGHNVLMVDQLWLWFVRPTDDGIPTIITSFPDREGVEAKNSRILDDLQENVFKSLPRQTREPIENPDALVSRILTLCCKTLDRHQHIKPMEFLQLFQSTIGDAVSFLKKTLLLKLSEHLGGH